MPNRKQANHQAKKGASGMTILQYTLLGLLTAIFMIVGAGISTWVADKVEGKLERRGASVETTAFVTMSAVVVIVSIYAGTILGIALRVVGK